jgi:small subunit ribosomal protein S2
MIDVTIKQLLEAGVHFGHQTSRWNPKMKPYIFGARNGIHIIDLQQTVGMLREVSSFVSNLAADGGQVLFVGTKKQAQEVVKEEAERCGMYYVNNRWPGGMLTNFQTIKKSIERLKKLDEMLETPSINEALTKKELLGMSRERDKLMITLGGIKNMRKLPDAMFVVDTKKEEIAVREANKLGIPVVAAIDTNCDPDAITHKVPGNDDAIRAIRLFTSVVAESAIEGRAQFDERQQGEGNEEAAAAPAGGAAVPAEDVDTVAAAPTEEAAPPVAQAAVTPTEPVAARVAVSAVETAPAEAVDVPTVEGPSDGSGEEGGGA